MLGAHRFRRPINMPTDPGRINACARFGGSALTRSWGVPARFLTISNLREWILLAMVGVDRGAHRHWKKTVPGFEEAFEVALQDVRDQEFDRLGQDKEPGGGLKEVMYDRDGGIKYTRFRQSEGLRKMRLMALDPDRYNPEKSRDNNVTLIVTSRNEGGWGDEEDQQPREILSNEGGQVTRPDGKGGGSSTRTAKAKELDSIPETEVIESVETGTCEEEAPCVAEKPGEDDEAPIEEHTLGNGDTWRQRQFLASTSSG